MTQKPKGELTFVVLVGGLRLPLRPDQRRPGPHREAGDARRHAPRAQEPVGVAEAGVEELGEVLGRRRVQHHSHPLHVGHRDVRPLGRHFIIVAQLKRKMSK